MEMNVQDVGDLDASRRLLRPGSRVYVSHLPKQSFGDTIKTCAAVKAAGFDPVPHIPVRLMKSHGEFQHLVGAATNVAVTELLLIAGDYAQPAGPFSSVSDVLRSMDLRTEGIARVSIGGHPEGHTKVVLEEIRRAEIEKSQLARDQGLEATIVTQFFFESAPFLQWAETLRSLGVTANIRAGLAGPAKVTTLLRFAMRCGVGPSMKALSSRPGSFAKLLGEHGPEHLLTELAHGAIEKPQSFQGLHMFGFGGYLRTCKWLHALASGQFHFNKSGELVVL